MVGHGALPDGVAAHVPTIASSEPYSPRHEGSLIRSVVQLYVSVARADDGSSVTGLDKGNFRVAALSGPALRLRVIQAQEQKWETSDTQLSGCYLIAIDRYMETDLSKPVAVIRGEWYTFGVQVRVFDPSNPRVATDQGQTVAHIQSLGE